MSIQTRDLLGAVGRLGTSGGRWALLGAIWSSGVLCVAHADAQVLTPVAPAFVDANGVIVSPFDNPVITATVPMGTTPRPGQMSIAMDQAAAWLYRGFGVWGEVHCPADDLLCAAVSGGDKLTIGATPQPNGLFDVPFGGIATLNIHGARLGTGSATMQLWQEIEQQAGEPVGGTSPPTPKPVASLFSSVSFKTTPDTLIVPLNVVVVVPSADQPEHDFMARFANRTLMEALFDDQWSDSTSRFPDGPLEVLGKWNTRTTPPVAAADGRLHRRVETVGPGPGLSTSVVTGLGLLPDDVFVQCGIQFRLQQFVTIEETDQVFVNRRDAANQPICSGLTESIKLHGRFQDAYKPLLDRPELVTVVFTNLFDHPTCFSRTMGEYASSTNDLLISTRDIASDAGSATPRTLSHELGHSLGLAHTTCTGDAMDDLMCEGGSTSSHIVGCDTRDGVVQTPLPFNCVSRGETPGPMSEVSCDKARRGARKFITDLTPPTVDAGADQAVECTSPTGADVTLTATASDPETGILTTHWSSPSKPNLGSTSTVTTAQPIGKTTYTVSVNNPGLMTATDTVDVTVRDTTPPTVAGTSLTTQNGCATGGVITLPVPTATDACTATTTLTGTLIQTDGVTLPTPTPIVGSTAALPPGTHVVSWVASDGTNSSAPFLQTVNVLACFASGQSMNIGDRSQMKTKEGGWAPITNHGTGALEVSASARVGSITSVGAVALRSAVKVTGSVTSAGRVDKDNTAQVSGAIKQFATVNLPPLPTLSNPWPPSGTQQVTVEPDQTRSITPGTYKLVSVKPRATLLMAPGTYYIEDLQVLEPQSVVKLSGATTIEVKTRFVHRGAFRNGSGAAAPVAVRYRGSEQVFLDTSFYGSVLAPNATVTLGGSTNLTFRGQFIARRLEVRPDIIVTTEEPPGATVALASHATEGALLRLEESAPLAEDADSSGGCSISAAPSPSVWSPALALLGLLLRRNRKERRAPCK